MKRLCNLPNGCSLYYKDNEAGGRTYYSDEVGGSVFVWDTALVDMSTLLAVITEESIIQRNEKYYGYFNHNEYIKLKSDL